MLIVSEAQVKQLYSMKQAIPTMERALIDYSQQKFTCPVRSSIANKNFTSLIMPACSDESIGCKIISICPDNQKLQIPVVNSVYLLLNNQTG